MTFITEEQREAIINIIERPYYTLTCRDSVKVYGYQPGSNALVLMIIQTSIIGPLIDPDLTYFVNFPNVFSKYHSIQNALKDKLQVIINE